MQRPLRLLAVALATLATLTAGMAQAGACDDPAMPVHTGDGNCIPKGAHYCGNSHFCVKGQVCTADGSCAKPGDTPCGGKMCSAGLICAPDGQHCTAPLAPDRVSCGDGHLCPAGKQCSPDGTECVLPGQFQCGASFCNAGDTCANGKACVPHGALDCGDGSFCATGSTCLATPAGMSCKRTPFAPRR
jgi:hypothetical protein